MNIRGGEGHWKCHPRVNPNSNFTSLPVHTLDFQLDNWTQINWANGSWDLLTILISFAGCFAPPVGILGSNVVTDIIRHDEPSELPYNAAEDQYFFGSILGGLGRAFAILDDSRKPGSRSFGSEGRVAHGTSIGEVYAPGYTNFLTEGLSHELPNGLGDLRTFYHAAGIPYTIDSTGTTLVGPPYAGPSSPWILLTDVADLLSLSSGPTVRTTYVAPWWWEWKIVECSCVVKDSICTFTFTQDIKTTYQSSKTFYESRFTLTHTTDLSPVMRLVPGRSIGSVYNGHWPVEHIHSYHLGIERLSFSEEDGPRTGGSNVNGYVHGTYTWYPLPNGKYGPAELQDTIDKTVKYLQILDSKCSMAMPDIYGSAYVAASSAIVDYDTFLRQNYLESISEIGELMSLYPDVKPLQDFLNLLPQGELLSGALRLADFAADTYLLYKFGLINAQADIFEFARKYDKIADSLREKLRSTPRDLRGKFSYTFTDGPLKDFTLVVRSKVVIRFPRRSITMALLPTDVAGITPTPSRIWEMIPFSFVVDWFTNNSTRWKLGEGAVRAMTAVVFYTVHSYSLHFDGLDDNPFGLSFAEGSAHKYYVRLPSMYFPGVPRTTRYDWLAPTGGPPWKVAGSLLWSFVR
jgi:hypothetical protein